MSPQLQLVQQERRFYARQKFRNAGNSDPDALFIIKTEPKSTWRRHPSV